MANTKASNAMLFAIAAGSALVASAVFYIFVQKTSAESERKNDIDDDDEDEDDDDDENIASNTHINKRDVVVQSNSSQTGIDDTAEAISLHAKKIKKNCETSLNTNSDAVHEVVENLVASLNFNNNNDKNVSDKPSMMQTNTETASISSHPGRRGSDLNAVAAEFVPLHSSTPSTPTLRCSPLIAIVRALGTSPQLMQSLYGHHARKFAENSLSLRVKSVLESLPFAVGRLITRVSEISGGQWSDTITVEKFAEFNEWFIHALGAELARLYSSNRNNKQQQMRTKWLAKWQVRTKGLISIGAHIHISDNANNTINVKEYLLSVEKHHKLPPCLLLTFAYEHELGGVICSPDGVMTLKKTSYILHSVIIHERIVNTAKTTLQNELIVLHKDSTNNVWLALGESECEVAPEQWAFDSRPIMQVWIQTTSHVKS